MEASAAGHLDIALAVRQAMRRGGVESPALPEVVVRATAAPIFFACLAAALVLTVAAPERLAAVLALAFLALGLGTAVLARRA
jgi:hypothetical protein